MKNDIEKLSYSVGLNIAQGLQKDQGLEEIDAKLVGQAIVDVFSGTELKIDHQEAGVFLNEYFAKLEEKKQEEAIKIGQETLKAGQEFLAANQKKEGVTTLESGLQYEILKEGKGNSPSISSTVTTHYHGTTIDGGVFDSSVTRGTPASFPVSGVIAGWTEALQLMTLGAKWKLFVPSNLAYGERGAGANIGAHATLIFDIELLEIS